MTLDEELVLMGVAENTNRWLAAERDEGHVHVSGIDNALNALTTSSSDQKDDRHPEKRRKAAFLVSVVVV